MGEENNIKSKEEFDTINTALIKTGDVELFINDKTFNRSWFGCLERTVKFNMVLNLGNTIYELNNCYMTDLNPNPNGNTNVSFCAEKCFISNSLNDILEFNKQFNNRLRTYRKETVKVEVVEKIKEKVVYKKYNRFANYSF